MKIPADTRAKHWFNPARKTENSFRPQGSLQITGPRKNPERSWGTKDTLAARLFVGLSVGQEPTWTQQDLIDIVIAVRKKQGHKPDSSFLTQKGIFTSHKDGSIVVEDSVQIVIIATGPETEDEFTAEIEALAETLATKLVQEEVVAEIQRNGLALQTFGVKPKPVSENRPKPTKKKRTG